MLALAILNVLLLRPVARGRSDEASALGREQGLLMGIGTIMLSQADALRMTAAEDRMFVRWSGHQARELQARQRFSELNHLMAAAPDLFTILGSAAVLALGATKVMSGELTLGGASGVLPRGDLVSGTRRALRRICTRTPNASERHAAPSTTSRKRPWIRAWHEGPGHHGRSPPSTGRLRLAGHVELRNVTFGYNRNRPPLIKDFSLAFTPGQRVAVVGPSGSGKSTLSRLVAGILHPWSGEILFDGRPRDEIPDEVLSRSLSMVDQRIVLFSATVRDNLTLWNPAVLDDDVVAAARDAAIHDEILSRPRGYATPVDEDGGNFSGGQRQRPGNRPRADRESDGADTR